MKPRPPQKFNISDEVIIVGDPYYRLQSYLDVIPPIRVNIGMKTTVYHLVWSGTAWDWFYFLDKMTPLSDIPFRGYMLEHGEDESDINIFRGDW